MNCRHFRQMGMAALAGLALAATISCGDAATQGKASAYLVMDRLQGAPGAKAGDTAVYGDILQSDVVTKGSIFEDPGQVTLHGAMKNPGSDPTSPTKPSSYSLITVDRYHVTYIRSDGRNVQGVDVPYAFDGAATGTIGDTGVTLTFVLVRAQAKAEPPLMPLRNMGGSLLISTIAEVTFYGHDQTGNAVTVTGRISVNFADWADPD
jgi:hypothetical protein